MRKEKGIITVFLVLILTILMAFFFTLIDISRIKSARNQLVIASDAAITSALTNYDSKLYENYGILSFKDDGGILDIVRNIFKENITPTANNLFKIDVSDENISIKTDGNPFEGADSNKIMQEQMIYSMKYKGTENLVRQVFEKIANMLGSKKAIEEAEKLQEIDKEADKLNKKFETVQKGKLQALETLFVLAKNNKYEVISGGNIGYIKTISKSDLIDKYYSGNSSVKAAVESLKEYDENTILPQIYSVGYTKMILETYKQYLTNEMNNMPDKVPTTNESGTSEDGTTENPSESSDNEEKKKYSKTIDEIDSFILKISKQTNALNFSNGKYNTFVKQLNKGKINDAIGALEQLLNEKNRQKYNEIVNSYEKIKNDKNSKMKESAEEDYEYYTKNLNTEVLKSTLVDLKNILNLVTNIENSNIQNKINEMINSGIKLVSGKQLSSNVINQMDLVIGLDFEAKNKDVDSFITSICNNTYFKTDSNIKNIVNKAQVDTLNRMTKSLDPAFNMKPPQENSVFERFYKVFKDMLKRVTGNAGRDTLIGTLKKLDTGKKISGISLPSHTASSQSSEDKLSEKLDEVTNLGGNISLDGLLKSGGELADKLYIIEYIMTNFKDLVDIKDIENLGYKRIPEETDNSTILDYEVEAIISGKYSDDDSKTSMLDEIILTRTVLNTVSFFNYQKELKKFTTTVAGAVSALTAGVVPMPAVKYAISTVWIALETRNDIIDIFNGYSVPLIKDNFDQWTVKLGFRVEDLNLTEKEALSGVLEQKINSISDKLEEKSDGEPYNRQNISETGSSTIGSIPLMYTDLLRLELLTKNKDKLIDGVQDVIVANMNTSSNGNFNYSSYKTNIEVGVNESNVNILFKTPTFSTKGAIQKFKEFSFKKSYN